MSGKRKMWVTVIGMLLLALMARPVIGDGPDLGPTFQERVTVTPPDRPTSEPPPRPTMPEPPTLELPPRPTTPTPGVSEGPEPVIFKWADPVSTTPGGLVTFTVQISNVGTQAVVDAVLSDELSPYLIPLEATTTQGIVKVDGQMVTADVGTIGPGFVVDVIIRTQVRENIPVPSEIENVAVIHSPNSGERTSPPIVVRINGLLPVTGQAMGLGVFCLALGAGLIALGMYARRSAP